MDSAMSRAVRTLLMLALVPVPLLCHTSQLAACSLNPTANITSPKSYGSYYIGDPVLFDGTTSTANCGTMTSYTWYVRPNGFVEWTQVSTGSSYNHVFLSTGSTWQVRLTVTNSAGKSHTRILIAIKVENQPSSQYFLTDHMGSVRAVVDEAGVLIGWDDYYPFGLVIPQRSGNNNLLPKNWTGC
jgi:hypothetical protein